MGLPHKSINQSLQDFNDDDNKAWIIIIVVGVIIAGIVLKLIEMLT